jgi:hypothetical protein
MPNIRSRSGRWKLSSISAYSHWLSHANEMAIPF